MDLLKAIVYGIVQGITEFLPVSSTAHLRLVPELFRWPSPGTAFTAVIQLGTVASMLVVFGKDLWRALVAWLQSIKTGDRSSVDARIGWAVFIATIPIVIAALALKKYIKGDFRSLYVVGTTLILMGIVMLIAEQVAKKLRPIEDTQVKDGFTIGLWQCLSLIPGMSRSGSTITGALFAGFDRNAGARLSFLMSVPAITLAGLYEAYSDGKELSGQLLLPTLVATVVSFIVGLACIKWLIAFLTKSGIKPFVLYRVIVGALILGLVLTGKLDPNEKLMTPNGEPPVASAVPTR